MGRSADGKRNILWGWPYHKLGYDQLEKSKNYKKLERFNLVVGIILFQLVFVRNCCIFHDERIKKMLPGGLEPPTFALLQHPRRFTPALLISTTL